MKILGIEASALVASVALVEDENVLAEYTINLKKTHSQTLMPMLETMVKDTEMDLNDIDAIAVSAGPGSFTGLRIGVASAKGLSMALKKPLVAVSGLDAMAYAFYKSNALICPIMDARRGEVYTGIYEFREEFVTLLPPSAMPLSDVLEKLKEIAGNREIIFLGDGVPVHKELLEHSPLSICFAKSYHNRQRAALIASLGLEYFKNGKAVATKDFEIEYLRKSQAEREREERESECI